MNKKELVNKTIDSLINESDQWTVDEFKIQNRTNDIAIWLSNGLLFYSFYKPVELNLDLWSQIKLSKAINQCKINIITKKFNELQT